MATFFIVLLVIAITMFVAVLLDVALGIVVFFIGDDE